MTFLTNFLVYVWCLGGFSYCFQVDSLLEDEIKKIEELASLYTKQNNTFHEEFNLVEMELELLKADLNVPLGKSKHAQTTKTNAKWNAQKKETRRENRAQPSTPTVGFSATMIEHNQDMNLQDTVKFQNLVTNDGNGFDHISGIFRAPVRGLYFFSVIILSHAGEDMETEIVKNGDGFFRTYSGDSTTWNAGRQSTVLQLDTGDQVWIRILNLVPSVNNGNVRIFGYGFSSFSGFLISK